LSSRARKAGQLLTLNRKDFLRLHNESSRHAGMVLCTFDLDFEDQAQRIHDAVAVFDLLAGRLVRVNKPHR
jgi:hypothetical protein